MRIVRAGGPWVMDSMCSCQGSKGDSSEGTVAWGGGGGGGEGQVETGEVRLGGGRPRKP